MSRDRRRSPITAGVTMGSVNPLHQEPTRPKLHPDGTLANPIGATPFVPLLEAVALRQDQLTALTTYSSLGFEYLTDENALPARVRGVLRLVSREHRVRHPGTQRAVGHLGTGTHGGHIVAVSLGGFASGPNLFPQMGNFNVSAYARLERGWRAALREGFTLEVDIALSVDPDDGLAPEFVVVTYWEDDEEVELPLLNETGVQ